MDDNMRNGRGEKLEEREMKIWRRNQGRGKRRAREIARKKERGI